MLLDTHLTRRRLIVAALLAAGLQTGILAVMMKGSDDILANGTPVTLKTVPVDPRDLLRGEYVVLAYDFSALDTALITGEWPTEAGDQTLYVALVPDADGTWHAAEASFFPLIPSEGRVIIRSLPFRFEPSAEKPSVLRADYGLERYYVPEGEGKALEEARNGSRILVEARVLEDGSSRIASLRVLPPEGAATPSAP